MRKRAVLPLFVLLTLLLCLAGCVVGGGELAPEGDDLLASYDGTWYWARNGIPCTFGDGHIYQDDDSVPEGRSLAGLYTRSETDECVLANLIGVGGVDIPRPLYIVQTDQGDALCDTPDGTGNIYFYRSALAALAVMEAREAEREALEQSQAPVLDLTPDPELAEADGEDEFDRTLPADPPDSGADEPEEVPVTGGNVVWIPKSGSKYHSTPSCSGMKNPKKVTLAEAKSRGYTPCKRCH